MRKLIDAGKRCDMHEAGMAIASGWFGQGALTLRMGLALATLLALASAPASVPSRVTAEQTSINRAASDANGPEFSQMNLIPSKWSGD